MSDTVIQVENLSKKYIIGHQQQGSSHYVALRDVLSDGAKALGHRLRHPGKPRVSPNTEEFWALKDVSFEVKRGEVVGIIGRNGAGKSTLLKILSRITEPTEGRVRLRGRVASLLEVGTGFHPELTGRENIFLNGAILGMSRAEINRKFDEIVEFAEVTRFLDTPVKRYSSGMYVRLAFAVAAHLEPEILVVDEVLAVGDAAFQKKCLGKMETVSKDGRTVFFVSHNMTAIENLCSRAVFLNKGSLYAEGATDSVISKYLEKEEFGAVLEEISLESHPGRLFDNEKVMKTLRIFSRNQESSIVRMGADLEIRVYFEAEKKINGLRFGISIEDMTGKRLINFSPSHQCPDLIEKPISKGEITCNIPSLKLVPNTYYISLILGDSVKDVDRIERAGKFQVDSADVFGTGFSPQKEHGLFYCESLWNIESDD